MPQPVRGQQGELGVLPPTPCSLWGGQHSPSAAQGQCTHSSSLGPQAHGATLPLHPVGPRDTQAKIDWHGPAAQAAHSPCPSRRCLPLHQAQPRRFLAPRPPSSPSACSYPTLSCPWDLRGLPVQALIPYSDPWHQTPTQPAPPPIFCLTPFLPGSFQL